MFYIYFFPAVWLCWLLYWKYEAGKSKKAVKKESSLLRLRRLAGLVVVALLFLLPGVPYLNGRFLPVGIGFFWLGAVITIAGLLYTVWARTHLGSNWSGSVTIKQDHSLIQTGPYAITRHPIYTGFITGIAGSAIALGEWRGLAAFALVVLGTWRKLRKEEEWLTEQFGEEYTQYMDRVKGLIPYIL